MSSIVIPDRVLDDACLRFLTELDSEDLKDSVRVFFKIEEAHWFYLDHYCEHNPLLPRVNLRDFCYAVCHHVQYLNRFLDFFDDYWKTWRSYKASIPTAGAILLDHTLEYVLVVESFPGKRWGFPKGKKNGDESMPQCAVREVLEETGFDISRLINPEEYLELSYEEQFVQLFIVHGVPRNAKFEPRTRGEVKSIEWMTVKDLPGATGTPSNADAKYKGQGFFMIRPFINPLRKWIELNRKILVTNGRKVDNLPEKSPRPSQAREPGQMFELQAAPISPEIPPAVSAQAPKLNVPLSVQRKAAGKTPKKGSDPTSPAVLFTMQVAPSFMNAKAPEVSASVTEKPRWPLIEFPDFFMPEAWKPENIRLPVG